uniref:Uncharacterized protein n=1 Tax=Anopheles minimus TaxID=112268 RepID=A0A182WN60_9DIPT
MSELKQSFGSLTSGKYKKVREILRIYMEEQANVEDEMVARSEVIFSA